MAAALGMQSGPFAERFLREVPDPKSGQLRLSLREREEGSGGRCILLEGHNDCSVYEARPEQCRTFPFWESILSDPAAFERARAVCPGIAVRAAADRRERAFKRLEQLYAELEERVAELAPRCEMSGLCCRFEEAGHELFATALEADYAVEHNKGWVQSGSPGPLASGRCPYHVDGMCKAREGRALGCRTYFCDPRTEVALEDLHEEYLRRVRDIEKECEYPAAYGRFPAMLAARGVPADAQRLSSDVQGAQEPESDSISPDVDSSHIGREEGS